MREEFFRTAMLLSEEAVEKLQRARVAVFGIGAIDLIDSDCVSLSNINRQLLATHSTVGMLKVEAGRPRILDINPEAKVNLWPCFYNADTSDTFELSQYDYIIDAIDTVSSKLLIQRATEAGTPIISCMGTGNKLDPSRFEVADISKTAVCPLARVMRKELGKRGSGI